MQNAVKLESFMLKSNLRRKKYQQLTLGSLSFNQIHSFSFILSPSLLSVSVSASPSLYFSLSPLTLRTSLSGGGNEALSHYTSSVKGRTNSEQSRIQPLHTYAMTSMLTRHCFFTWMLSQALLCKPSAMVCRFNSHLPQRYF